MKRILLLSTILLLLGSALSCGNKAPDAANGDTPTEAYKRLFAAVKAKDTDAIRAQMTRRTLEQARSNAKMWGKTEESVLENGRTMSTKGDNLPPIRDERIADNMGAVEVWNSKDGLWEDLPFMIEDGKWKLALGELFGGIYKFPGKGRSALEQEAANALSRPDNIVPPGNREVPHTK